MQVQNYILRLQWKILFFCNNQQHLANVNYQIYISIIKQFIHESECCIVENIELFRVISQMKWKCWYMWSELKYSFWKLFYILPLLLTVKVKIRRKGANKEFFFACFISYRYRTGNCSFGMLMGSNNKTFNTCGRYICLNSEIEKVWSWSFPSL